MKRKILILAIILSVAAVVTAQAQVSFRLDANFIVPAYNGVNISSAGSYGDLASFAFFIPEVDAYVQFTFDPVRFGAGLRFITFFGLIDILTPEIWFELHLDPVVLRASVAGGAALFMAPIVNFTEFSTGPIVVPDVSVGLKLADFFRFGVGGTIITNFNYPNDYFFSIYGFARFAITIGGEEKKAE